MWKQENRKIKDLALAAKYSNISIDEIIMLDDKEIIAPEKNWIQIPAFLVSPEHIEEAMNDQALLNVLETIFGNNHRTPIKADFNVSPEKAKAMDQRPQAAILKNPKIDP